MTILYINYNNYINNIKFNYLYENEIYNSIKHQAEQNNINVLTVSDNDELLQNAYNKIPSSYKKICSDGSRKNYICNALRIFITKELLDNNFDDEILYLDFDQYNADIMHLINSIHNDKKIKKNKYAVSYVNHNTWFTYPQKILNILNTNTVLGTQLSSFYFKKGSEMINEWENFYKNFPVEKEFDNYFVPDDLFCTYTLFKHHLKIEDIPSIPDYLYSTFSFQPDLNLIAIHDEESINSYTCETIKKLGKYQYLTTDVSIYNKFFGKIPIVILPHIFDKDRIYFLSKNNKISNINNFYELKNGKIISYLPKYTGSKIDYDYNSISKS